MPRVHCRRHRTRPARALLAGFALLAFPVAAADRALEIAPYATTNLSPFGILYGVPALGEARMLRPGRLHAELGVAAASHFEFSSRRGESIFVDGETHRLALRLRRGFAPGYEYTLELPYVSHQGGYLDGFIINWHEFFGLAQGGREGVARDQVLYTYTRDGVERVRLAEPAAGAGDVRIGLGLALSSAERTPVALRAELKLPTGQSTRFTGSGAADLAIWLSGAAPFLGSDDWKVYGGGGIAFLGAGEILTELQRRRVPFGTAGIGWRALPQLAFKVQVDAHGPLYRDSRLAPLGRSVIQLGMGGSLRLGEESEFEFVVLEDITVGGAPDVTLRAALKMNY